MEEAIAIIRANVSSQILNAIKERDGEIRIPRGIVDFLID